MEKLHHANVIIGEDCRDFVFKILKEKLNFNANANPDFLLTEGQFFGIDDVRDFGIWAIGKPLLSDIKVSFIIVKSITFEAQNAMLKVLEEPPLGTYIFISLQSLGGLLPTFLSRVRILDLPKVQENLADKEEKSAGSKFLNSDIKGKLALIRSLSKKEDKNEMKDLIKNLEEIAYRNKMSPKNLKNVLTAKIFASTRGSSPKMLLEWLSCVL
jgi:DNA polymerase III subunit delta'